MYSKRLEHWALFYDYRLVDKYIKNNNILRKKEKTDNIVLAPYIKQTNIHTQKCALKYRIKLFKLKTYWGGGGGGSQN
jgi:hypothetical protein